MHVLKAAAVALMLLCAVGSGEAAAGPGEPEAEAIQAVILDQLAAFRAEDMERAFSHASPSIQSKFGTPSRFRQMVETGYPVIWRPERFGTGALRREDGRVIQTMIFQDAAGRLYEADYEMIPVGGAWRINGVWLKNLPGLGS